MGFGVVVVVCACAHAKFLGCLCARLCVLVAPLVLAPSQCVAPCTVKIYLCCLAAARPLQPCLKKKGVCVWGPSPLGAPVCVHLWSRGAVMVGRAFE